MPWPMRSALDPRQQIRHYPNPKPANDLCSDCEHERRYHGAAGCGIEQCGCQEFTKTPIREQRDALLIALKQIVETDFLKNASGVRQAIPVRWNRALEIANAAIERVEGK